MPKDMQMSFEPVARSLISQKTSVAGALTFNLVSEFGTINLRLSSDKTRREAGKVLGLAIPNEPNACVSKGKRMVVWLGPDEWLLQAPVEEIHGLQAALRSALNGMHVALTVVSDHSVAIELKGEIARRILEKGCPLDLHPHTFAPGHCAQSHFLQATIILIQRAEGDYLLRVRRSMAEYLWDALVDAITKEVA